MKSKNPKIQIFKKGMAIILSAMFLVTPISYATTSLDDSYLESSWWEQIIYGTVGSTAKEIEEYFNSGKTTLYTNNETQLRALAEYINNGNDCSGKEIILLDNIELDRNNEWVPIKDFNGTFNGNNHIISGLRYSKENKSYEDLSFIGLFQKIKEQGIVKNLIIEDILIDLPYTEDEIVLDTGASNTYPYTQTGVIAGRNEGLIENCIVRKGEVRGLVGVGGISGANTGIIKNCISDVTVNGYALVGGISGQTSEDAKIINCTNNGKVSGEINIGGIVGKNGADAVVSNCINNGDIIGTYMSAAGIIANNKGSIKNCINNGLVKGATSVGGICGSSNRKIENCLNSGNINGKKYVGGILAATNSTIDIKYCTNGGEITGEESVGEIVGYSGQSVTKDGEFNEDGLVIGATEGATSSLNVQATFGPTNVIYNITKNGEEISEGTYLKPGDILKVTATFDKYLAKSYGPLTKITEAPILKINNSIEMIAGSINASTSNYTTTIEYTYTVQEGDNLNITTLNLYKTGTIYAVGSDYSTNHPTISVSSVSANVGNVIVDTTKPIIATKVYVENMLETERYTAGKEILFEITTGEIIQGTYETPQIQVSFSESGIGKYNYSEETDKVGYAKCKSAQINIDGTTTWIYSYQIQEFDEGNVNIEYKVGEITDLAGNVTTLLGLKESSTIYSDTTAPAVTITPNVQNFLAKEETVTYEIKWSEELAEFTKEDITVNNGKVTELVKNEDGTYTATVKTNIEKGNVGDLQVIIEENACQDLVGQGNVRTESVIRVDRKAPALQTLEAYVESKIKLNSEVDVVKEYYKTGEEITVVATFNENITAEKIPELVLQFSESKNSVIPQGIIEANKITYTYTIVKGDKGEVSVRAFNGTVVDAAGNETKVVRKALDGNTIIVDTDAPSLDSLNVITAEGTYKAGKTIEIHAIYDENVYALKDNEIKNISQETAPTLKVKFGNGEEREAIFKGYAGEDKTKLEYTVALIDTDNGVLSIVSYDNKETVEICDIAGNIAKLNNKQTGNEITADNIRPVVQSVTAVVENPSISGTDIYYKEGNTVKITLTFSEEVSSNKLFPEILIGFSEEEAIEPTEYNTYAYESDWNVNSRTIEYSYTIRNGENGYLWVEVPEGQFKDVAGNTNIVKDAEEKLNVFADTTIPTVTLYRDTEETQNNQTITIKATFNENVYDLNGNRRITLTTTNAPKLIYSFGDGENREIGGTSISGATITYTITKDAVEDNGDLHYELAKGNLCDRAGNELYTTTLDTTAPVLESVVITSNAGEYTPYCNEGKEIYVIATFNESIKAEEIKLKASVGNVEISQLLDGEIVEGNDTKIKFTYTVKARDMGVFKILDICGVTDNNITEENADKTYGWVRDEYGNQNNIYSLEDEKVTATGKAEADTKDPYITSIKAIADGKEVAKYTKEENKDAVITVGRTNENIVEYIVTYNEKISILDKSNITITNGIIKSIEYTDLVALNEYKITVQTTVEGVQSLIINEATVEDKAGNTDGFVRLDAVTVDFTKPTVRFISEYNGGIYVLPTNIDKVEIRPNIEISEDIAKVEYKWDNEEYVEIENYSTSSDIAVPTKAFTEYGQYELFIKVVDLAGNVTETSKTYEILNSYIGISANITECTNEDVTVTVLFGEGLTDNRKVTFKAEGSNEVVELNATGTNENGTEYTIGTNGTIYAEATDRVGNKVFTEDRISNIDKELPVVELSLYGANLVIGTGKDKATIATTVKVEDENLEEIKYIYSNNETLTAEEKVAMKAINNYGEAKTENALEGTYYLHVLAVDRAGNETEYRSSSFTVANSNTLKDEEGNVTFSPADENTIKFEREQQYVYVTYGWNLSENQDITFTNEDDGYALDGYAQVLKPTTVTAIASDVCGNIVTATYVVDSVEGPEFEVIGNPEGWTNQDVNLEVSTYEALKALTVNGTDILSKEEGVRSSIIVSQNGDYEFIATDIYGNISKQTITVSKIDKELPVISKVENAGKEITIIANDGEGSGIAKYAISTTTETPGEWSESNVIKTTEDGTFYVWVKDNAGNITVSENPIIVDTIALELEITGNSTDWTNNDIKLVVKANKELSSLKMGETQMDLTNPEVSITENGTYEFIAIDVNGNETKETVKVTKIDKDVPVISKVENAGKEITITATDEISGVKEYAITSTTEEPVEWSKSNVIKVTEDGIFYAWAKDNAGNVVRYENSIVIDTTAPTVTFNYLSQTITVGMPLESYILTNEDAIISYSWDNENWVVSEEKLTSLKVSEKSTTVGKYTLYVKAKDESGNESQVQTLEFNVVNVEEIRQPEIIFEDIPTVQINGVKYVKVSSDMTVELLTDKMNKEALCGKTPEYIELTEDGTLRTGAEIAINGSTKYVIIVNGDVNCDGKVTFLGDVVMANNYRIGQVKLSTMQMLAADVNNSGSIEFIPDIIAMNNYRLGIINSL